MSSIPQTPYHRVSLEQGSSEWHRWRSTGIGASDAPVIMGENPWKDISELIAEKRRPTGNSEPNAAMARGTALEPEARASYCEKTGRSVEPACLQSTRYEWLRASVDGISTCGSHLVEIKCGNSVYKSTAQYRRPPKYYFAQLQHALAVTNLDVMDFWCFLPGLRPVHVEVRRDEAYIKRMLEAEQRFWEAYVK